MGTQMEEALRKAGVLPKQEAVPTQPSKTFLRKQREKEEKYLREWAEAILEDVERTARAEELDRLQEERWARYYARLEDEKHCGRVDKYVDSLKLRR